jgi:copper(I)-binding protein
MKPALALVLALLTATPALSHSVTEGALEIIHPNIPQPAKGAKSAAGYMAISNEGATPDRLIGVETPAAAKSMLHTTSISADGVASMSHLDAIEIPAGDTILLEPGGMHVMLMGLTADLIEGDMVNGALIFEKAGRVEIEFMVDPPGGIDHSTMDHSN